MGTEQASQSSKCGRSVVASPRETGLSLSTVCQHDDGMDAQTHWQNIYGMKAQDAVSWYRPHLEKSLELIEQAAHGPSTSIIDVGGGESTLVDDLIARGCGNITILDISQTAIDVTTFPGRNRYGVQMHAVNFCSLENADVLEIRSRAQERLQ
jgi:hypothetical protein